MSEHNEKCWAMPDCDVCGRPKKPWGRDAGAAAANGFCSNQCEGYTQEPQAGHFWSDEEPALRAALAQAEKE